jgi:ribosome recycling factor
MVDAVLSETKRKMEATLDATAEKLGGVRTGTANTSLLTTLTVDAYGTQMKLQEVATVSAPEPRLLVVSPYDKNTLGAIDKAIQAANLGLNPQSDGNILRVPIPALTEERRKEIVKAVGNIVEEGKVALRNVRRDANDQIKKAQKDGDISEDDAKRAQDEIQKLTDDCVEKLDEMGEAKEAEVMAV